MSSHGIFCVCFVTFAICCCLVLFLRSNAIGALICCSNAIGGLSVPLYDLCIAAENLYDATFGYYCAFEAFFCYLSLVT